MASGIEYKIMAIILLGILSNLAESVGTLRLCGRELADALALVCEDRGYNVAFEPRGNFRGGRFKRGIVDECCKRGCTLKTLESYCSEARPTRSDTLQISKRSELSSSGIETAGTKSEETLGLDNYIRSSKSGKLRPLVLLYSNKYRTGESSDQIANLDRKKHKNVADRSVKDGGYDDIVFDGYNPDNKPLDSSEIMAELVESGPESNFKVNKNSNTKFITI